jgi:predicted ABC-type ATPase
VGKVKRRKKERPRCLLIAGPNGAGKTTFAKEYLPNDARVLKQLGYHVEIIYLQRASSQLALRRIAGRVRQGGHNVPRADVLRRFSRSWQNFQAVYRPLADAWAVYDNSSRPPKLIESG